MARLVIFAGAICRKLRTLGFAVCFPNPCVASSGSRGFTTFTLAPRRENIHFMSPLLFSSFILRLSLKVGTLRFVSSLRFSSSSHQ
ncbi:hypothetical protein EDB87DRAFT_1655432 [Lactarius vividus]|nr:hypothetical protein EDB87DRAFT_1655432 [Lactarius vividus]